MIISASRRTDIPAFYSPWFFNRIKEGYVLVPNPFNSKMISKVSLNPAVIDCIVFWTKNPAPMIPWLDKLPDCPYYFQVTLTPYDEQIERYLPSKRKVILPAVRQLARQIGPERVVWRYDPVFLTERYSVDFHKKAFAQIARLLRGNTVRCVISFLDWYPPMEKRLRPLAPRPLGGDEMRELAASFGQAAAENGMRIFTCAETADLSGFGVEHGCCIDRDLLERIGGRPLCAEKDRSQRAACGCVQSVDIGAYDTCPGGCLYCYADHGVGRTMRNLAGFDPSSPLLCSSLRPDDTVRERKMQSGWTEQTTLFG